MSGSGIQTGLVQDFGAYVAGLTWSTMITALGILLIPMVVGVLIFNAVRGIGGLWSGSM